MAWNHREKAITLKALNSFSGMQYRIVELATSEPNAADYALARAGYGVLQNTPLQNEAATVVTEGEVRIQVGSGGCAIGDLITNASTAGFGTKVMSGMTGPVAVLGVARTSASSGSLATLDMSRRMILYPNSAGLIGDVTF